MQVTTLVRRRQPSLNTLNLLLEVEPFPGPDPESEFSFSLFCTKFFIMDLSKTHDKSGFDFSNQCSKRFPAGLVRYLVFLWFLVAFLHLFHDVLFLVWTTGIVLNFMSHLFDSVALHFIISLEREIQSRWDFGFYFWLLTCLFQDLSRL